MTTDLTLLEARELLRKYAEENAQLKHEIHLAGGHLQSDGRCEWTHFSGPEGPRAEILSTPVWIIRRKQDAAFIYHSTRRGSPSGGLY